MDDHTPTGSPEPLDSGTTPASPSPPTLPSNDTGLGTGTAPKAPRGRAARRRPQEGREEEDRRTQDRAQEDREEGHGSSAQGRITRRQEAGGCALAQGRAQGQVREEAGLALGQS